MTKFLLAVLATILFAARVNAVATREARIVSVTAQHIRTARRVEVKGRLFADCTGDATVGYLAGADYEVSAEGLMGASNLWNVLDQADREQVLRCECKDKDALTVLAEAGNVANLFMAGRNISVTHEALGAVRVMRTCGMMGEIIGKAAWVCVRHGTSPRGVYEHHLPVLRELMEQPGALRRDAVDGPLAAPR